MFNLKQELTVNLISVKPVSVEGTNYLTLWAYQQADGTNKAVIGGEVMKLSADPSLESEFRKLFDGAKSPLLQCDISAELRSLCGKAFWLGVTRRATDPYFTSYVFKSFYYERWEYFNITENTGA